MAGLFNKKIYKRGLCGLLSLTVLGSAISAAAFSMSWFSNRNHINNSSISGSVAGAWFAGGDGSAEKPYEITTSRHVYNLAWLQYMGVFNDIVTTGTGTTASTQVETVYFIVDNDVDMGGLAIPPIGTEEYPFVGNFNGNGKIISNLTISNNSSNFTSMPNKIDTDGGYKEAAIIGFFGVVGQYNGSPAADVYGENRASLNSVYDLYLDKITIKNSVSSDSSATPVTNVLAGFLAGYVNGNMTRCGVYRSKFDFVKGTTNISTNGSSFSNVSDYSLIGAYNSDDYAWTDGPGGGGQENDWGGSIDMRTLNRRLSYMYANGNITSSSYYYSRSAAYKIYLSYGGWSFSNYDWNSSVDKYMSILGGTSIPINIDKEMMGIASFDNISEETAQTINGVSSFSNEEYINRKNEGEAITDANTGYLVGGDENRYNASIRTGIRGWASSYYGGVVYESFYQANKGDAITYTTSGDNATNKSFALFTLQGEGSDWTTYRIVDDINGSTYNTSTDSGNKRYDSDTLNLTEYKKVRESFDQAMSGSQTLHGFHFLQYLPDGTTAGTTLSNYVTSDTVNILGRQMENYQLIKGALNFTVEKQGKITAILGAGYTAGSHSLFDLYQVTRNGSNKVTALTQIQKIYTKTSEGKISNIVYNTKPDDSYSLAIDIKSLSSSSDRLDKMAAYYFEIPVSAGDYAIATATGSSSHNAYLMYLDIGANASSGNGTEKSELISKIDFIYEDSNGLMLITDDNYEDIKSGIAFAWTGVSDGELIYCKRFYTSSEGGTSTIVTTPVYYWDTKDSLTMTLVPSTGTNYARSNSCIWT